MVAGAGGKTSVSRIVAGSGWRRARLPRGPSRMCTLKKYSKCNETKGKHAYTQRGTRAQTRVHAQKPPSAVLSVDLVCDHRWASCLCGRSARLQRSESGLERRAQQRCPGGRSIRPVVSIGRFDESGAEVRAPSSRPCAASRGAGCVECVKTVKSSGMFVGAWAGVAARERPRVRRGRAADVRPSNALTTSRRPRASARGPGSCRVRPAAPAVPWAPAARRRSWPRRGRRRAVRERRGQSPLG